MKGGRGQASIELIAIAVVILLLFSVVVVLIIQKNFFTSIISNANENLQECDSIAAVITNFRLNPGYSETRITMQKDIKIRKNNILVNYNNCPNCHYCYYNGIIEEETCLSDCTDPVLWDLDYTSAETYELTLSAGTEYKIKKIDRGVVFCETGGGANAWC